MVFASRDTNATPREGGAGNHKPKHRDSLPYQHFKLRDENSPFTRGRNTPKSVTPPSQRLLSSTKASAVKISSSPRAPLPRSSQPLRQSPLPNASCATTAADHAGGLRIGRAANTSSTPSQLKDISTPPQRKSPSDLPKLQTNTDTLRQAQISPTPLYQNASMPSSTDKLLLKDKPLPSRPVLSFLNSPSPSKRGRSLLDATDRPMALKVGENEHEWPTLTPRSASAPATEVLNGSSSPHESVTQRSASASATTTLACNSEPAPEHTDNSGYIAASDRDPESPFSNYSDDRQCRRYPARKASLGVKASNSSLAKIAVAEHSRQLAPSPSSFSRPRVSSSTASQSMRATSTSVATTARAQRTASRIPIPDSRKATLVDVKSRRSSGSTTPLTDGGLSFGFRRLDALETTKILDDGVRRRQLKRSGTERDTGTHASVCTQGYEYPDTPTLLRSNATSPSATVGTSSSDEEDIVTPTFKSTAFLPRSGRKLDSDTHKSARRLFEGAVDDLHRCPPPTSPFTGPLPTIPSQAVLPAEAFQEACDPPGSSRFSALHRRLSELYDKHVDNVSYGREGEKFVSVHARSSLFDLLNDYTVEDQRQGMKGVSMLDPEARAHITRALSMLEGTGEPVNTEVSNDVLLQMFGHLRRRDETVHGPRNGSLVVDAAAAQKFLAVSDNLGRPRSHAGGEVQVEPEEVSSVIKGQSEAQAGSPSPLEGVASKWSGSTASLEPQPLSSHPRSELLEAHRTPCERSKLPSAQPPSNAEERLESIGHPSKISSKAGRLIGPGNSVSPASPHDTLCRTSSPTLSTPQGGSLWTERDNIQRSRGGFAAPTASAEAKKTVKMPTPRTKPFSISGIDSNKQPSAVRSKSAGSALPKTPHQQSKGRNMLSKINNMFSAKRDKKSGRSDNTFTIVTSRDHKASGTPRPASRAAMNEYERDVVDHTHVSSFLIPSKSSLIPKMPTSSPPRQASSRSSSASPPPNTSPDPSLPDNNATHNLCASLIQKAKAETQPARKERLLAFAKVLNDSLISAREAQISAETAQHAAKSAQMAYEMTAKSVAMLQRLATGLTGSKARR